MKLVIGLFFVLSIGLSGCSSLPESPPLVQDFQRSERMAIDAYVRGNLRQARIDFLRAYQHANRLDDRRAMARSQLNLGVVGRYQGVAERSHLAFRRAEQLFTEMGDLSMALRASVGVAEAGYLGGERGEALVRFSTLWAQVRSGADPALKVRVLNGMAMARLQRKEFGLAATDLEQALKMSQTPGLESLRGVTLANQARLKWRQGDLTEAMEVAQQAITLNRELADPLAIAENLFLIAQLRLSLADIPRARQKLERVRQLFDMNGQLGQKRRVNEVLETLPVKK